MPYHLTKWPTRLAAVWTAVAVSATVAAAQSSVSGRAYGVSVQTPTASQSQTPLAVLPSTGQGDGQIAQASGDAVNVPGTLSSQFLNSVTTGALSAGKSGAQSVATVGEVNLLGGLIRAARVVALASATNAGSGTISDANGSSFEGLQVNGVPMADDVAPNTRVTLPGVGYVVLNQQIQSASGITVNMIHVVLQGLLGNQIGEIIVCSATSSVN